MSDKTCCGRCIAALLALLCAAVIKYASLGQTITLSPLVEMMVQSGP